MRGAEGKVVEIGGEISWRDLSTGRDYRLLRGFLKAECWFFPEHAGLKAGGRLIACPTWLEFLASVA